MKNRIIFIITMLLAIACTIIIYTLLFEEKVTLFYINVGITCLAEIILLANTPILSSGKLLTVKNVAISMSLNLFAIIIFLWTAGYSLLINQDDDLKILYIGLLVITTIFLVINVAITIIAGGETEQKAREIQETIENKKKFSISIDNYWIKIKNELSIMDSEWKDKTLKSYKIVLDKISMIPAHKFSKHPDIANELTVKLEEIYDLFQKVVNTPEQDELQSSITLKIKYLDNFLQTIKSTL